jgi:hypothetical protein
MNRITIGFVAMLSTVGGSCINEMLFQILKKWQRAYVLVW